MLLKRARKPAVKVSISTSLIIITLGDEQQPESLIITFLIEPPNKPTLISSGSSYPPELLFTTNDTEDINNIELTIQKGPRELSTENEGNNRLTERRNARAFG
jgi:hypothetical protein